MLSANWLRGLALTCGLLGAVVAVSPPATAATFVIVNNDGAGEGFNDTTAAAPVGGNPGTTLGAQRLNAFQAAADVWGALLVSNVTIRVAANFDPLSCTATSGTLGSAGPTFVYRDFSGAPQASTFYWSALANALAGTDLNTTRLPTTATIAGIQVQIPVDTTSDHVHRSASPRAKAPDGDGQSVGGRSRIRVVAVGADYTVPAGV